MRAPVVGKDYLPTSLAAEVASPTPEAFTPDEQASLMPSTNELEVLPNQGVSFKLGSTDSEINIGQGGGRLGVTTDVPEEETQPGLGAGTVKLTNAFQYSDLLAEEDYPNYIHTNIAYTSNDLDRLAAAGELKPIGYNGVTNRPPSSPVYAPPAPPEDVNFFRLSGTGPPSPGSGVRTVLEDQRNAYLANPYEAGLAAPQGVSFIQTRGPGRGGVSEYSYYLATPASAVSPLVNFLASQKSAPVSVQRGGVTNRTTILTPFATVDPVVSSLIGSRSTILNTSVETSTSILEVGGQSSSVASALAVVSGTGQRINAKTGLALLSGLSLGSSSSLVEALAQVSTTIQVTSLIPEVTLLVNAGIISEQAEDVVTTPLVIFGQSSQTIQRGGGLSTSPLLFQQEKKKHLRRLPRGRFRDYTIRNQLSLNIAEAFGEAGFQLAPGGIGELSRIDTLGSLGGLANLRLGGGGRRRAPRRVKAPKASRKRKSSRRR